MQTQKEFCWKIGGEAGYGILVTGDVFGKTLMRGGLSVYAYGEYPSLIRGGHNTVHLRASTGELRATVPAVDLLIALNSETVERHAHLVTEGGLIIYDSDVVKLDAAQLAKSRGRAHGVPLTTLAKEAGGEQVMRNTVSLGVTLALLGWDLRILESVLEDAFGRKGQEVVRHNLTVAQKGFDFAKEHLPHDAPFALPPTSGPPRLFLTGNDAMALGAIRAGCAFYAAYPMTPASSILHTLAAKAVEIGMVVKHTEDEIAAMNMVVGASFAGVRAMTATSGGGFCLMVEALGMGAMMEAPLVCVEAMRGGPSTGLPTWTSQGDLRFVLHAAQDEFPRIVLAPGDVSEAFSLTVAAFNLADRFQVPVLLLTDKMLAESHETVPPFAHEALRIDRGKLFTDAEALTLKGYKRYAFAADGVSPRTIPGQKGGEYICTSYEHDETGFYSEDADNRVRMVDKRFAKIPGILAALPTPHLHGPAEADVTLVSFGSTKGAILESLALLAEDRVTANFVQLTALSPFPSAALLTLLQKAKRTIGIEGNRTAQLAGLIREYTGIALDDHLLQYDARPLMPEAIRAAVLKKVKA